MSGSLGGGRAQQREQIKPVQNPMTQDLIGLGMQNDIPSQNADGGSVSDILKLLEKYWKVAL